MSARCVVCYQDLSMKPETADRRYFDKVLHGWAHLGCDPEHPKSPEEELLMKIFGVDHHQRTRERVATRDMAEDAGHQVTPHWENYINNGTPSRRRRFSCSCGWESEWFRSSQTANEAMRAHIKDAAIYG